MKVILIAFITILLLQYVTSMGQGNNKNNKNNQGNKGNQGQKVTLFPCHNRLLRAERIVGGPPGKSKTWKGFVNVKNANKKPPLTVTIILDFPTQLTVVCISIAL